MSSWPALAIAQPEATCSSSITRRTLGALVVDRDREVPDLAGPLAEAAIDPIVDDQCAADPAADGHVEQGRVAPARRRTGPRPGRRCRRRCGRRPPGLPGARAIQSAAGNRPSRRSGTIFSMRPRSASTGPPKPMPDGLDLRRGRDRPRRAESGKAAEIWSRMPDACRAGSTCESLQGHEVSPRPRPIPSWSLVPPISMPRTQRLGHAISSPRRPAMDEPPWRRSGGTGRR